MGSPLTHRRKSVGPPLPSLGHHDILTTPYTLPPCPGCSPVRQHGKYPRHIKEVKVKQKKRRRKQELTTAFFVFCLMGLSRDAHSGGTMSPSFFFSFSTVGLGAGGFNSLLWGGGKSVTGIFSRYGSEMEGRWCCWMWWGCTLWPTGLSVQELWMPKGSLPLWKLPPLLSAGLCPEAGKM